MKLARRAAAVAFLVTACVAVAFAATSSPAGKPAATHPAAKAAAAKPAPAAPAPPTGDALDQVAAMVNDEAVLASDVEEQLYAFLQQSGGRPDSATIDTLRHQILDQMIDEKLLQGEAKRQAIVVTDAEVERQVDAAVAQAKERIGGDAAYQEQLKREGMTEQQLRERYRTQLRKEIAVDRMRQKLFPKKTVTATEAEAFFAAHKDKFQRMPSELKLQIVHITPSPDSVALAAGRAKINAIRKRIVAGEKFAKVAAEVSEDPGSKDAGGDLGFNTRGHMVKPFEDAMFSLGLNELSQPVLTSFGWHLIQVLERDTLKTPAGKDSLDDAGKPLQEAHARHILVRVTPTDGDIARSRALATRVRDEARKGTQFEALVHRYSTYNGQADADGNLGFVPLPALPAEMRAGLDSVETGHVSDVLLDPGGYDIFKVLDRHPERDYTLDELRKNDLPGIVADIQRKDRYDEWMKGLRAKAQIEYR